jgi:hypothetical protein
MCITGCGSSKRPRTGIGRALGARIKGLPGLWRLCRVLAALAWPPAGKRSRALRRTYRPSSRRPGSGAATDFPELTLTALSFQVGNVAQAAQQRRITVNRGQRTPSDISGRDRQESTRVNFARVGYENKTLAVVDGQQAGGAVLQALRDRGRRTACFVPAPALQNELRS